MKKLLICILLTTPAFADIAVTPGSGKTVHTDTVNGLEYQAVKLIDGTSGGTSSATVTAAGALKVDATALTQPVYPVGSFVVTNSTNPLLVTSTGTQAISGSLSVSNFPATYTVTPGTGTTAVSGTFFQATQPVSPVGSFVVMNSTNPLLVTSTGTQTISGSISNTGFNINNAPTVLLSTAGVNGSTIAVVNAIGTTIAVSGSLSSSPPAITTVSWQNQGAQNVVSTSVVITGGSIANTGFNVNNAPTVVQSTAAVNGSTIAVVNAVGTTMAISGNLTSSPPAITTVSWQNQGAQSVISTYTVMTTTYSVNTNVTNTVPVTGTFFQTTQPVSVATPYTVILTTSGANASTTTVVVSGTPNVAVTNTPAVSQSGTWTIQPGNTQNTTSWLTTSSATAIVGLASSTTLPSPLTDATTSSILIDSSRRQIVADIPFDLITTVNNTAAAPNTTEVVLVSSATAPKRTLLCGCIFMNSSATNTGFTIYQSTSSVAANLFYPIGVPANYVPAGIRPDCGHPFFSSTVGGAITIKPAVTAATVTMNCTYLQK